ncbi:putative tail protein [Rhizobium phage RHph_X3_2]|nr:putative tail protein [Rhizobium phage RHph_X3_2]
MAGIETTLLGTKVSISTTSVDKDANLAAVAALVYTEIESVGNLGDYGVSPNNVNYNVLGRDLVVKSKGVQDGGDCQIEVAYIFDDPGQMALRSAALTKFNWVLKIEYADAPGEDWSNTIVYLKGIISGPLKLGGGPDDFHREQFTMGVNALPITVNPVETP